MVGDKLSVAVVGGGIGGLTAAHAMARQGIDVHVYERAPALGEIGAGVFMTPNSLRLLDHLGLGEALAQVGAPVGPGSQYYRTDGTVVAPILTTDSAGWNGTYGMHRADLLDVLARSLDPASVHLGATCIGLHQGGGRAQVEFAGQEPAEADVVVAADGINSVLRPLAAPDSTPHHSGSVAYRGLIDAEALPEWTPNVSQLWMGEGKHFLVYPVRSGRLINYVGFVPSDAHTSESWSAPGDVAQLRAAFAGWDSRVVGLLDQVETTYWWGLYDREPLPRWTHGRLTLLGDAAHPMLPHLGQGANQAIEDAVVLAELLGRSDRTAAPQALQAYESLRRPRTMRVQQGARANGHRYDSQHDYEDLEVRDAEITDSVTFRRWLYDYDALREARAVAPVG